MRHLIVTSLFILSLGCTTIKKSAMDTNQLNGTWVPVKQEIAGTPMPEAALQQKLIIDNKNYTVIIGPSTDKGTIEYNGNKMDIYGKEGVNAGKHFTAIYKHENGQLTICYNLAGDSYPEAFETKGKPAFFLSVFKKI